MKLVVSKLRKRAIAARLSDWPRILPTKHRATPAGAGFGSSRYSSPSDAFRILYAAEDFSTAFAEAVVRDRFEGKSRRYLPAALGADVPDGDQLQSRAHAARSARRRGLRTGRRHRPCDFVLFRPNRTNACRPGGRLFSLITITNYGDSALN